MCGVFGIYNHDEKMNVAKDIYTALYALQHRGQQSAGMAVNFQGKINCHKDLGLVSEVFNEMLLKGFEGNFGCGHVLSAREKDVMRDEAQPYLGKHIKGQIAIAINGNIANASLIREDLNERGAMFQSNSNAELIAHICARERMKSESTELALLQAMSTLKGAYSMVIVTLNKLIAVRDENGFRPLCLGQRGNCTIIASESCAVDSVGGKFVRDIEPGEIVVVDKSGVKSLRNKCAADSHACIFEHVYLARPDSTIDGQNVHLSRRAAGAALANVSPVEADIVIGVPDSGLDAALGYAEASGIPYGVGIIKNRYVGRTFIQHDQTLREQSVKIKLNPLSSTLKGKRVVMVEDSIVRGTTTANLISLMREAGVKEIHMRIASPPFLYPCYFGTDIDSQDKLIAHRLNPEEIRKEINVDTLAYLSCDLLPEFVKDSTTGFCTGCFNGKYPVEV